MRRISTLVTIAVTCLTTLFAAPSVSATANALTGVRALASSGLGECALLGTGGVDCWGTGVDGQLGDGRNYVGAYSGADAPVAVLSTTRSGRLGDVATLASSPQGHMFCAVLTSTHVDCWGAGEAGGLGDGQADQVSDVPVTVRGPSGSGLLDGVDSVASNYWGWCALLVGGGVDCWGADPLGAGSESGTDLPAPIVSPSGTGTLGDVASLYSTDNNYCALLTTGGVDCWGAAVGDSTANPHPAVPAPVRSPDSSAPLTGVATMASTIGGYCALLHAGTVDCWGADYDGQLGDGHYTAATGGSRVPVAVVSTTGTGTLTGVTALTGDDDGYCAILAGGRVACWGKGTDGQLGNGTFYGGAHPGHAVPVVVLAPAGTGDLSGVSEVTSNGESNCALVAGAVDCWGYGEHGSLGDDQYYATGHPGSARPVAVVGANGSGRLTDVASVAADGYGYDGTNGFCALLRTTSVTCWGDGQGGQLGDGTFDTRSPHGSARPVTVR